MRRLIGLATGLLLAVGASGCCQFASHLENEFGDFVDYVNYHEPDLTHLYHPGLDPLRIGKPDWCSDRFNRVLCPCACGPEPVSLPAYPPPSVVLGEEPGAPPEESPSDPEMRMEGAPDLPPPATGEPANPGAENEPSPGSLGVPSEP